MGGIGPFEAEIWAWKGKASWFFVTVPPALADVVRAEALSTLRGWGSVRVVAAVGDLQWETSLFPDRQSGSYLLPLKAGVRRRLGATAGDVIQVRLDWRD